MMGKLFELSQKINEIIERKKLDKMIYRGKIGLRSGVLLSFSENTPDDSEKISRIKVAIKEVLGEAV